jgi:ABC-2 type transport system ATP-binding protein
MIADADAPALEIARVEKSYKKVRALREAPLTIPRGEVFGLLGPNGAGKSTLVKSIMTIVHPDVCEGTILGARIGDKRVLSRVGYLPEQHQFPDYLTGEQVLHSVGAMSGVHRRARRAKAGELLELVGMTAWADTRVGKYSKGMRQRLGIAQALVNDPEIAFFDEPSDGVDPVGRRDIQGMIEELKRRGVTIFLNSHLLTELEKVCDRVAIMLKGRVVRKGTLDELTADERRVELEVSEEHHAEAVAQHFDGSTSFRVARESRVIRLYGATPETAAPVLDAARERGAIIRRFVETRPSLEDLFMTAVEIDSSVGADTGEKESAG